MSHDDAAVGRAGALRRHRRPGQEEDLPGRLRHDAGPTTTTCRWSASRPRSGTTSACASTPARRSRPRAPVDEDVWDDVAKRIDLRARRLPRSRRRSRRSPIGCASSGVERPLFYLAIPPELFDDVIVGLESQQLHEGARVVVEKPFGRDLALGPRAQRDPPPRLPGDRRCSASTTSSARSRSRTCSCSGSPTRCSSRCGTATSSPACRSRWPRTFGVEGRGRFYESVGALRDVVQNHLLQVVALLAMEPPAGADAGALRDERSKLFRQIRTVEPASVVRGQYRGYREEDGRRPRRPTSRPSSPCGSRSTRGAGPACRWLIRTGKHLPVTATEAVVEFNAPPRLLFSPPGCAGAAPEPPPLPARPGRRRDAAPPDQGARATSSAAGRSTSR